MVEELSEGRYAIRAELSGYKLKPATVVSITKDRTTIVDLVLEFRCIIEDVVVSDGGIAENGKRADLIAHIRIIETSPPYRCQSCVCTDHRVQLVNVAKRTDGVSGAHLLLLQTGAGVLTDDPQATKEPPYARGQEFLAFLNRTPHDKYVRSQVYLFHVTNGTVEFKRTDAPTLTDGMRVDAFTRRLREFVRGLR